MAKVSDEITDAPKKAPRKRAVRRVVATKSDSPVRRTRVSERETSVSASDTVARKAPSRGLSTPRSGLWSKKSGVAVGALLLTFGGAAWLGFSDAGQIDVNAEIGEANQRAMVATQSTSAENTTGAANVEVPVQNTPISVEGLRGRGVGTPVIESTPPVVEELATTTASSSEEMTAEGVDEDTSTEPADLENSEGESTPTSDVE